MHSSVTLTNGYEMPLLGFGTYKLEGENACNAIEYALNIGYRHIDTADSYGNHRQVGDAMRSSHKPRDAVFLTTKVWRDDLQDGSLQEAVHRFLEELQVEYLDMLLMHWPNPDISVTESFNAMQSLQDEGVVRSIGVSNFTIHHLREALDTGAPIVNNQVEYHPTLRQDELLQYCRDHGIALTAYSPLGRTEDLEQTVLKELAEKYDRTPAQIVLNWLVHKGIAAIPKASSPEHIEANCQSLSFEMHEGDYQKVEQIQPSNHRLVAPSFAEFDA